ncbi:MAG: FHA domain-containing protein, partial [Fibrobacter sp.]|nr:FHA domain-containing protein [Fibrobacter sp.]
MAYLSVIEGPLKDRDISLTDKISIGRNPASDLCLNDTSVSRQHAEIQKKDGFFVVIDIGSANGTLVNNTPLHKLVPRPLYENDLIVIGTTSLIFHGEGIVPPGEKKRSSEFRSDSNNETSVHHLSRLSFVMTSDENEKARFNATIDASKIFLNHSRETSTHDLMGALRRLQAMVQISVDLGAVLKVEVLAEKIMSGIFDIFPYADRAFIMLRQGTDKQLRPVAARRRIAVAGQSDEFAVSHTVIRTVTEQKQSILLSDVSQDSRFSLQKSIVELSIRSLMCAPFICQDELMGVIGVDTVSANHPFNSDDLLMLTG